MSATTRPRKSFNDTGIELPPRPSTTMRKKRRAHSNVKFMLSGGNNFGKDAPKFTIPSSRKEEIVPIPLPGPGEYEIYNPDYRKLKPVIPKSRPRTPIISPTANVEFADTRTFPQVKETHIFNRHNYEYFDVIESPGPSYLPTETSTQIPHRISPKIVDKNAEKYAHLGPGTYTLKFPYIPREPAFNFYGPKKRDDWMVDRQRNPGPGTYDPNFVQKKEPQWTIGRKSRLSKRNRRSSVRTKKDLIAIDQCIIRLDELANPAAARLYIMTHPILRDIVHEILENVLFYKPDEPVEFIEEYFEQIRKIQTPKKKKASPPVEEVSEQTVEDVVEDAQ
ncbi:hypothetical protein TRFO_43029 [Tritrichomonas foetus]|uniref:Uncharacterized protein n=1 Tax=Tritrichomonas foetus TaxID=1144522 RepID=A0A1J4KT77_9EUKA|nr:hypothetical protein [Tritrichomonas foetus]OHT14459.1 hypothetical protein TRFO_43029 [Tritrichomonas foetus]|eukprot:OHT14459.1 hypothetical protein TRFO_43029 [Tritrichomonas foetus]